ncbi:exocyst complex component EXO70B1 [Eucalyptus grandis]|uniref:exocyst complex component EXO70B1 n=1 Tax=Eucalyptus grandis TaxID=71139 RepID=UPI00192E8C37|nr:exocyst complex component EXO70B1 [Eucalyptus grandis]XP_018726489.2 exocyst complex component EXO70B1 [Eucalyptus grandis]
MAENGEEKLLAVARHIAKTLGRDESMADDILQIFSNFDGRFSRDKLSPSDKAAAVAAAADGDPRAYAALDRNLSALERQISHFVTSDNPIWADAADAAAFLDAVDELIAAVRDLASAPAADKAVLACLSRAEELTQQAMFRLEDEFRSLMEVGGEAFELSRPYGRGESNGDLSFDSEDEDEDEQGGDGDERQVPVAQPLGDDFDIVIDALPSGTINDLHEIAKRMVAARFGKECSHVYSSCRREFLEESMSRLGLQKLSIEEAQKLPWQELEEEIDRWMKAMKVALYILFPSERRLCDRVFFGLSSVADLCFMEVCRGCVIQLLNFADAVAIGSRAPERLFKVLDVFETMRDLMPEFESLFSDQYCSVLRNEAVAIWKRLGEAIRGIFMELENLIRRDPAKAAVPGGGLHPITRYVMNYLRAACRSRLILEQIFEESIVSPKEYPDLDSRASSSSLSVQIEWIMELLESNLEAKSKIYRDSALCSIFMMNNGRYIVEKAKGNDLGLLLGEDWIRKHTAKVRQYQMSYIRSSWNKVMVVLKPDNASLAPNADPRSLKEKVKLFNGYFEETCRVQSSCVIFDEQLREDLRISVTKWLVPAYETFVGRLQSVAEMRKHPYRSVEDIKARIDELFRGRGALGGGRK